MKYSRKAFKAILEYVNDKTLPVPPIEFNFLTIHTKKLLEENDIKGKSTLPPNFEETIDLKTFKITPEGIALLKKLRNEKKKSSEAQEEDRDNN
jgi:hypothetical protein